MGRRRKRRTAFCLVENHKGQVLLIQRGHGKHKGRWSLPGGFVDRRERSKDASRRETREETGLRVRIVDILRVGRSRRSKTFFGRTMPTGGRPRFQRGECLDARFFDPDKLPTLAFHNDRKAIERW